MRNGKFIKIGDIEGVRFGYGTINHKNLKSIYLNFISWVEPKSLEDDYTKTIKKTQKEIKNFIYFLNNEMFRKESIVDLDIKEKGMNIKKSSFMNLDVNLFMDQEVDFRSELLKQNLKKLSNSIIKDILLKKTIFTFKKVKNI